MKYKLINRTTNEEHLCDKVTIDGFDYYVSDKCNDLGGWHIDKEFKILSNVSRFNVVTEMKEVIATTNPNIDIPKVVDEVEELESLAKQTAERKIPLQIFPDAHVERRWFFEGHIDGYNKHKETHFFSEEDMIEFAEWAVRRDWKDVSSIFEKSTKELLQLWKKQQPKIVYYE